MSRLEILVQKAVHGDIEAYAKIIERTQHMACGYAFSILGDFHAAEDASQEAFIEAYQRLPQLKEPKAFLSWFRKIVFKYCDRQHRKRKLLPATLQEHRLPEKKGGNPAATMEAKEIQQQVAAAVLQLPQKQREVTTLFYVNGYSYGDISSFLDVPVATVKKRLHDSRNTLRERMIHMVENGLKNNMPDQHFAGDVIAELLSRPKLLDINGHPLRDAVRTICSEFSEYEYVEGSEVVEKNDLVLIGSNSSQIYRTQDGKYLRPETTSATLRVIAGRNAPIHLLTAGRAFRCIKEDALHLKVFHMLDAVCVRSGVSVEEMKAEILRAVQSIVGQVPHRWVNHGGGGCLIDLLGLEVQYHGKWIDVAEGGVLSEKKLSDSGLNSDEVGGFGFGLGLERLAAIKLGINDIRQLWQHPYV